MPWSDGDFLTPANVNARLGPIYNVKDEDYGAVADDSTDDTAAGQAANDAAEAAGGGVVYWPSGGTYRITQGIVTDAARVTHVGDGTGTVIRQDTWGAPCFEVRGADDVTIRDLFLLSEEARTVISGTTDGDPARDRSAGVYSVNVDRLHQENLRVQGFVAGTTFRGNVDDDSLDEDNKVLNCSYHSTDQGILAGRQHRLMIRGIQGKNQNVSQTGNPSHLVYLTEGTSLITQRAPVISDCNCFNNTGGSAYQFKTTVGLVAQNMSADSCIGLMSISTLQESVLNNFSGVSLSAIPTDEGVVHFIASNNIRNTFSNFYTESIADRSAWNILAGAADNNFNNIHSRTSMTAGSGSPPFLVRGDRNNFDGIRIEHLDAAKVGIGLDSGSSHYVRNISSVSCSDTVDIGASCTSCVVIYEPRMCDSTGEDVDDNGIDSTVITSVSNNSLTPFSISTGVNFNDMTVNQVRLVLASSGMSLAVSSGDSLYDIGSNTSAAQPTS